MGPWDFDETPDPLGGSKRQGSFRSLGRRIRWEENPFHWVESKEFSVLRVYHNGPFLKVFSYLGLKTNDTGTELTYRIDAQVRSSAWNLPARYYLGVQTYRQFDRAFGNIAKYLTGEAESAYPGQASRISTRNQARLRNGVESLATAGFARDLIQRLALFLRTSSDDSCGRIRPFGLADNWGERRESVLRLCLHATRLGLLDLSWELMCPLCRGAKGQTGTLKDLRSQAHCSSCNIRFDANFDRSVQVTFRPSPRIRPVQQSTYCVGGPGNTPHILIQAELSPHQQTTSPVDLSPGVYRLRGPRIAGSALVDVAPSHAPVEEVRFSCNLGEVQPPNIEIAPGSTLFRLENDGEEALLVMLEKTTWPDDAVTAAYVSSLQDFRDLFSSEVLAPEEQFEVRSLCFMFTDLKASTAMYREQGDAPAYALVRDHFKVVYDCVVEYRGAVVKTIGDAVMAVFSETGDAVSASLDIHTAFRTGGSADSGLVLKIGIHSGPCMAVNLNERLDYFGTTVNTAVRLQGQSIGGDVMISAEMVEDPTVREAIERPGIRTETVRVQLKGFERDYEAVRITWHEPPDQAHPSTISG